MAELCEKITSCQHAINEAEQRAALLKGVVICSNCQAEVDKDASYCPICGTEDSEGGAEEADAEPEESAEANEQEDEAAKETEEGEASDECTDNE